MHIVLVVVGKVKEEYIRDKTETLISVINKRVGFEIKELEDYSIPQNAHTAIREKIKNKEGDTILSCITKSDYVIALCIEGKQLDEKELKNVLSHQREIMTDRVVFVIGGSLGLSDSVKKRSNMKMSFSKMTFPHQLMRAMLLEAISNCYV